MDALEIGTIFMKGKKLFQIDVLKAVIGWNFPTVFSEVSLNDSIMFINGSVLNTSSRVICFTPNIENG